MSKMKNWMMDIEEFCNGYDCGMGLFCSIDEIVEDVDKRFQSLEAKSYAKRYLTETLGEL